MGPGTTKMFGASRATHFKKSIQLGMETGSGAGVLELIDGSLHGIREQWRNPDGAAAYRTWAEAFKTKGRAEFTPVVR